MERMIAGAHRVYQVVDTFCNQRIGSGEQSLTTERMVFLTFGKLT